MKVFANRQGFSIRLAGQGVIQCNRRKYGNTYACTAKKRKFIAGSLQCDCNFHIKIKAGKFVKDEKKKYRPDWNHLDCFVTIQNGELIHSGDCKPSTQQHIFTKARSGKYVGDISATALYTLCNSAWKNGKGIDSIVSVFVVVTFTSIFVDVNHIYIHKYGCKSLLHPYLWM